MSLWSIIPAAVGLGITALNKPKKKDYMPNTDYMDRYINSLRGRKRTQETYNLAMRPVLRQIGTQTARTRRQTGYELERQDAGGGAVLQSEISIGRQALQSTAQASDRAMALQGQDNRRIDERIAQTTMQREQMESQAHQAWDRATSQWKTKMWGAGASLGVAGAGAGAEAVQSAKAISQAHATVKDAGAYLGTLKEFQQDVKTYGADNLSKMIAIRDQSNKAFAVAKEGGFVPEVEDTIKITEDISLENYLNKAVTERPSTDRYNEQKETLTRKYNDLKGTGKLEQIETGVETFKRKMTQEEFAKRDRELGGNLLQISQEEKEKEQNINFITSIYGEEYRKLLETSEMPISSTLSLIEEAGNVTDKKAYIAAIQFISQGSKAMTEHLKDSDLPPNLVTRLVDWSKRYDKAGKTGLPQDEIDKGVVRANKAIGLALERQNKAEIIIETIGKIEEKYRTTEQKIDYNTAVEQLKTYQTEIDNAQEWLNMKDKTKSFVNVTAQQEIAGRAELEKTKLQEKLSVLGITLEAGTIDYELNSKLYKECLKRLDEGMSIDAIIQDLQLALDDKAGIK